MHICYKSILGWADERNYLENGGFGKKIEVEKCLESVWLKKLKSYLLGQIRKQDSPSKKDADLIIERARLRHEACAASNGWQPRLAAASKKYELVW